MHKQQDIGFTLRDERNFVSYQGYLINDSIKLNSLLNGNEILELDFYTSQHGENKLSINQNVTMEADKDKLKDIFKDINRLIKNDNKVDLVIEIHQRDIFKCHLPNEVKTYIVYPITITLYSSYRKYEYKIRVLEDGVEYSKYDFTSNIEAI